MEEKKLNWVENVNVVVENCRKEKVKKVSGKKGKGEGKGKNIVYKDIVGNLNKCSEGVLKSCLGVKKWEI